MLLRRPSMVVLLTLLTSASAAAQTESTITVPTPEAHGFVSQGFIVSSENNYLVKSKRGSFELSEVGINFTEQAMDKLRLGIQFFAHKPATGGAYNAKMDWFYLDYRWADWLGFRAGRTKLPFGLYNEINDIDSARVPILLPQSIYPFTNRDFLLAQTGFELYGRLNMSAAGTLDYRLYGGTIFLDAVNTPGSPYQLAETNAPYIAGGRVLWETPLEGFRIGPSVQVLRLDAKILYPPATFVQIEIPAVLAVASAEYAVQDVLVSAEYSRWYLKSNSTRPDLFPETPLTVSERAYAMASYRFTNWFQPGVYYSLYYTDVDHREGRQARQNDLAATLRFDFNEHWLLKLEGHYMTGTAALSSALNDNVPLTNLANSWAVFLAKTTAYF